MKLAEKMHALSTRSRRPGAHADSAVEGGRRIGESDNPYLSARRTWNDHIAGVVASRRSWQLLALLSLSIAFASVIGVIYVGSQSKFIPYVIEVDKLGQAIAVAPALQANAFEQRVVHASVASFISDARLVTPDVALQRKAIFRMYSMLSKSDPATTKANAWLNSNADSNPFARAARETVSTEIVSVIPQTADTWQVEWTESVYDRQGALLHAPYRMRALVTVYTVPVTSQTTEDEVRNNPLGIHIREFSWSRQL